MSAPDISVVIPSRGRPQTLSRCLLAVLQQRMASDGFEIIVANDRPDAATAAAVTALQAAHPGGPTLHYLAVNDGSGPVHARNVGWRFAVAPIVAFTDDDTMPEPDWLEQGLRAMRRQHADAVAGSVIVPLASVPTDYERDAAGLEYAEFVTANCFVRRELLRAGGGFDERFTAAWREDADLQFSLIESGHRLVRAPDAIVMHPVRPAGFGVSLKQQRKVQFDSLLYRKHARLYRERIQRLPRYDYYLTVGLLIAGLTGALINEPKLLLVGLGSWLLLTLRFCAQRLQSTSKKPLHVLEMLLTSALIPPMSLFWRVVGNVRYRAVLF